MTFWTALKETCWATSIWGPILAAVEAGTYVAMVVAPSCGTSSRVRSIPGGPPPLRGVSGTDRYGFRNLDQARTEQVRVANLLSIRTAEVAKLIIAQGGAVVIGQPAFRKGEVSILNFEYLDIFSLPGVQNIVAPQCACGAAAVKST